MTLTNDDDFFAGLETEFKNGKFVPATGSAPKKEREKFPCQQCAGTGLYRGVRLHQDKDGCFACKGKGYFYTSKFDRMKAADARKASKAKKILGNQAAFEEANPGLYSFLESAASWSSFAGSLAQNIAKYGQLTESQMASAVSMKQKSEERQAKFEAEKAAKAAAQVDIQPTLEKLADGFLSSAQHLKFPKLRLVTEDNKPVVLSRCGDGSRTPGHINITDGGSFGNNTYYGRISPDGKGFYRDPIPATVKAVLEQFNLDHKAAIKLQGIRTGNCCCCGRTLTDPVSVENGIGPICAGRWNF